MSELRGLAAINDDLKDMNVTLAGVSTDTPEAARRVVERHKLPFQILSDPKCQTIAAFGLVHKNAGPGGTDIAIPAQILIGRDGKILGRRVARLIQDRPSANETLENVRLFLAEAQRTRRVG
ncbi:MAG TPA: redoxin domain-containing protein [Phycisphaerae bacterium]|nr:redoxin domain-containing protein [Phycisphaerae bacterium]